MAIRIAIASGLWTAPTTWSGGIIPSFGDDVNASGATISVNIPINVGSLYSTGGGYYSPTFACTSITCTGEGIVVGTFTGAGAFGLINFNGAYPLTIINSDIIGGSSANGFGVYIQGNSIIQFNGDIIGGTNATAYAVNNVAGGQLTFNGNLLGRTAPAARNTLPTVLNVTGNLSGGNTVTGYGLSNSGTGTTNITGNVTAGLANGFITAGNGLTTCVGTVRASDSTYGMSTAGKVITSTPCINSFNYNAINSTYTAIYASSPAKWSYRTENETTNYKIIYSAGIALGNPLTSNVRSGTTYGASSELTGTLIVPGLASVEAGVPVDNTIGTYYKTASEIVTEILTELLTDPALSIGGSFGSLIKENLDVELSQVQKNTNLIPAIV